MDNELRLIRYVYGDEEHAEEEHDEDIEQLLASDRALRTEYHQLRTVKEHLDARPRQRPDAAVIDRIVAAAAKESPAPARAQRPDREPVVPSRTARRRVVGVTSALAVLLVAVGVGIWQWEGLAPDTAAPEVAVHAPTLLEERSASSGTTSAEPSIPDWDETDDVVRLHHYIEALQARSRPNSWGSPGLMLQPASHIRAPGR